MRSHLLPLFLLYVNAFLTAQTVEVINFTAFISLQLITIFGTMTNKMHYVGMCNFIIKTLKHLRDSIH